jgi:hypothetical protein
LEHSQPFFARGFIERNPRFTITGLPNDVPLSHADGNKRILTDTLMIMQMSAVHNLGVQSLERCSSPKILSTGNSSRRSGGSNGSRSHRTGRTACPTNTGGSGAKISRQPRR